MNTVPLADLAPWADDTASQADRDRFRLLYSVARRLGVVGRATAGQWQIASVPVTALDALAEAVETEGARTYQRRVELAGGHRWQTVAYHPARARDQLLDRIADHSVDVD